MVRRRPAAADDTVVLLFARDPARWRESPAAAGITLVRPVEDGAYLTAMRPGAYYAIAVPATMVGERMSDPDLLALLAPHAQLVDIHEDAEARLDLTVWEP
jgi:hypothetical protein